MSAAITPFTANTHEYFDLICLFNHHLQNRARKMCNILKTKKEQREDDVMKGANIIRELEREKKDVDLLYVM